MKQSRKHIISIDSDNKFYNIGIKFVLEKLLLSLGVKQQDICYLNGKEDSIQISDIYIATFQAGEQFLCHHKFAQRKHGGLLMIVCNKPLNQNLLNLPQCLRLNTLFIELTESLTSVSQKINRALITAKVAQQFFFSCLTCRPLELTIMEKKVIYLFCKGYSVGFISKVLSIQNKTVYAHKRNVLIRLGLHSEMELLTISRMLLNDNSLAN